MYTNNPYAQGGWSNSANPHSINDGTWGTTVPPQASILGALPFGNNSSKARSSTWLSFTFTAFNPSIMNCLVVGPNSTPYFRVMTESTAATSTTFQDARGRNIAMIDWGRGMPAVEIRDITPKTLARQWLAMSSDRSSRTMDARGRRYSWIPQGSYICLFSTGSNPEIMARVSRSQGSVTVEITTSAIQIGLLEVAIVATVLMQCGRNID